MNRRTSNDGHRKSSIELNGLTSGLGWQAASQDQMSFEAFSLLNGLREGPSSPDVSAPRILTLLRWALKEAAIKAHSQRRIFLREVSVVTEPRTIDAGLGDHLDVPPSKPQILIDPPTPVILMSEHVARRRELRAFRGPSPAPLPCAEATASSPSAPFRPGDSGQDGRVATGEGRMYQRRGKVLPQERQQADASLSHDGDYVVAICQALDEAPAASLGSISDDGRGAPLHEPEYGDWGFCEEAPRI